MNTKNHNNEIALRGEKYIFEKLKELGLNPEWVAFGNRSSLADIIVNNKKIDVKISSIVNYCSYLKGSYRFNFHHHGKKQEGIDYFICICLDDDLIYVFPSHLIRKKTMMITPRMIKRGRYAYFLDNWDLLKK